MTGLTAGLTGSNTLLETSHGKQHLLLLVMAFSLYLLQHLPSLKHNEDSFAKVLQSLFLFGGFFNK